MFTNLSSRRGPFLLFVFSLALLGCLGFGKKSGEAKQNQMGAIQCGAGW
jgi:hypothetical protein